MDENAAGDRGDPNDARLMTMLVIGGLVALIASLLYLFAGEQWLRLLVIVITIPLLLWTVARGRDRYMRMVAGKAGLEFIPGFPQIPAGSPAHGRQPWGFTGYAVTGQHGGVPLNVYEHTYRWSRSGKTSRAHGMWWVYETARFPAFDVSVRSRLDGLTSFLSRVRSAFPLTDVELQEIVFRDDAPFSARFLVRGNTESQVRRLFSPELRQVLLAELDSGTVAGKGRVLTWDRPHRLWGARALAELMTRGDRIRQAFGAG